MRLRIPGSFAAFAFCAAAVHAGSSGTYWLEVEPETTEEAALRGALAKASFGGASALAPALRQVSTAYPGTVVSGLALLGAGLAYVDAGQPAEAEPLLQNPDIALTTLGHYASFGLGRARESRDPAAAGRDYLAAADADPTGALSCPALFRAADALAAGRQGEKAVEVLGRALASCRGQEARALLRLAEIQDERGERRAAAETYDRLDREHPASPQAREAARRLRVLAVLLPPVPAAERAARDLKKGVALFEAERFDEAISLLYGLKRRVSGEPADLLRVKLGRALVARNRVREAAAELGSIPLASPHAAEAGYHMARLKARRGRTVDGYESVATRFPGTPWAEEALLALANFYQKDARDEEAVPYYRQLLAAYPDGRYADRAAWRVAWADYRAGRFEQAAECLERAARLTSNGGPVSGFLYWAGRARLELKQTERARHLLHEAVRRFKYTYHGLRARETLARLPALPAMPAPAMVAGPAPGVDMPEPQRRRIRQLLLIDRLDEALEELRLVPSSARARATVAWIEWRRGRLRPALSAMRQAYPEYVSEAGDRLPPEVLRILYPLEFGDMLTQAASGEGLDPSLVAALIRQESTFDAGAVSRAGARGLMQVIPPTGRSLARNLGVRFRKTALHDPQTSLEFGTRYLRQLFDRFGGAAERALAAYNAGPHRVDSWTASRPGMSAEEFIESIPFTETRNYVMNILAGQQQYKRIYGLQSAGGTTTVGAGGAGGAEP